MNPPTTLTNHNPPATIGCGLNPNPIRREESDTPQVGLGGGGGAVDCGVVFAVVHVRACAPARQGG